MADDTGAEPLFRANKRRKIFRKRPNADEENGSPTPSASMAAQGASETLAADVDDEMAPAIHRVRKAVAKKHGVAFTSSGRPQQQEVEASVETALVPIHPSREQNVMQTERFVKPTGKTVVEDDKHLTAFIDSKLAEMRSATSTPNAQSSSSITNQAGPTRVSEPGAGQSDNGDAASSTAAAQHTTRRGRPQPRPKRPPFARDASDVARDSLIEDIMKESAVPLYDRSISGTSFFAAGGRADNEDAAAEAFKQQFLIDMEEQNRRSRPNPAPFSKVAAAKGTDRTSHGPKLGGSRSQRERLKAAQAAEAAQGGVKK